MAEYLFLTGWEFGELGAAAAINGTPAVTSSVKRTGSYSLHTDGGDGVARSLPGNTFQVASGVAVRRDEATDTVSYIVVMRAGPTGIEVGVACTSADGVLGLIIDNTWVATGGQVVRDTWSGIEVKVTKVVLEDMETADVTADVWQDGVQVMTGFKTVANQLAYGAVSLSNPAYSNRRGIKAYFDDWTITSGGMPGRGGIELLTPNGAGASTDLTPSAGSNYACVDEVPSDGDTTYVSGETVGDHDSYALSDLTLEGTVRAVQWNCRAKLLEEGSGYIKRVLRSGGADYVSDVIGVDTTYKWVYEAISSDPATSAAWTRNAVDALEAGVMIA
jgi:hypothetical protein